MRTLRATLMLAALLGLLPLAGAAAAGPSGRGRMAVVPTSATAGSTGNELTFTYTADRAALSGQAIVDVPRAWTLPQRTDPAAPGYVELKRGTCGPATRIATIWAPPKNRLSCAPPAVLKFRSNVPGFCSFPEAAM